MEPRNTKYLKFKRMNKILLLSLIGFFSLNLAEPVNASEIKKTISGPAISTKLNQQPVQEMKVYPNPTTGKLFLSLQGFKQTRIEIQVINVIGNVILSEKFYETEDQFTKVLELSRFNKGLYYVKIQADQYSEMRKVFLN